MLPKTINLKQNVVQLRKIYKFPSMQNFILVCKEGRKLLLPLNSKKSKKFVFHIFKLT